MATNLLTNPYFATDLTDWASSDGTLTWTNFAGGVEGVAVARFVATTFTGNHNITHATVPCSPGDVFSDEIRIRWVTGTPKTCAVMVQFLDASMVQTGNFIGTALTPVTNAWLTVQSINATAPAGTTQARMQVRMINGAPNDAMDIDDGYFNVGTTVQRPARGTLLAEMMADTPLAIYRQGEQQSSLVMVDSSGNARDGTYLTASTGLVIKQQVHLPPTDLDPSVYYGGNGTNAAATAALAAWMQPTAGLGLGFWIYPMSLSNTPNIITRWNWSLASTTYAWGVYLSAGKLSAQLFRNNSSTSVILTSTSTVSAGVRTHAFVTYDGTTARLYINGVEEANAALASPLSTGTAALYFARNSQDSASYRYQGFLDEVCIYDHALSAARVLAHYQAGTVAAPTGPTFKVWNGTAEVAATATLWNGTAEVALPTISVS